MELELAGPDWEGQQYLECTESEVEFEARKIGEDRIYHVGPAPCPFAGDVDAWDYQMVRHMECPLCGKEYEIDLREMNED